jgi:hypothetical protein
MNPDIFKVVANPSKNNGNTYKDVYWSKASYDDDTGYSYISLLGVSARDGRIETLISGQGWVQPKKTDGMTLPRAMMKMEEFKKRVLDYYVENGARQNPFSIEFRKSGRVILPPELIPIRG